MLQRHIFIAGKRWQETLPGAPRHVAYALQELFKKELERLNKTANHSTIGVGRTAELCNSFMLVPKLNETVWDCLDPVTLK